MQMVCKKDHESETEDKTECVPCAAVGAGQQRSDKELVIAAQNGELFALEELFSRHQKRVYYHARRYTANADEAHDLVQETLLRAFRNIGRFRWEARFSTWLNTIAFNTALSIKRREKHCHWVVLDELEGNENRFCITSLREVRWNPEEEYSQRERHSLLRSGVMKLRPKDRFILNACDLNECSIEEYARSQGIQPGAAKSRLLRARWRLSAAMKDFRSIGAGVRIGRHGE
jgi:RNA polymerase sigma-70 factor (ECF subfamily)